VGPTAPGRRTDITATRITLALLVAVVVLSAIRAGREEGGRRAATARVAVVLSVGGLGDRSFNDLAHEGLQRSIDDLGVDGVLGEPADHAEDGPYLDLYAREGFDLVVAVGYLMKSKLEKVAPRHPDTWFLLIDETLDQPNVRSYTFREEEGCFLVGALAAETSKTGTIGFVGGIQVPLLEKFRAGYIQGARHARPGIEILTAWAGSFSDPVLGKEKALAQHRRGADVVFQAAGSTGNGVIRAAEERDFFAIGVDANQNDMAPGHVLTSMRKMVEEAVYRSAKDLVEGRMTGGVMDVGLAEGMVGWALDEHNRGVVSAEAEARIEELSRRIVAGEIRVSPRLPEGDR